MPRRGYDLPSLPGEDEDLTVQIEDLKKQHLGSSTDRFELVVPHSKQDVLGNGCKCDCDHATAVP